MTYEANVGILPGQVAGADLSTSIHKFVKTGSSGIVPNTTAGGVCVGVMRDNADLGQAASVQYTGVAKVEAGGAISKGAQIMSSTTGKAIPFSSSATAAFVQSEAGPFVFAAGDTIVVDVDNGGNHTATFDAAAGSDTDTTSYPVADQAGLTEKFTIDGGTEQTVTFTGAHTTAAQIAASINAQLIGASAAVVGGQVKVTSDTKGTGSTVAIGTGTCALAWAAAVAGTGDVVNIAAVTAAEVKVVFDADLTDTTTTVNADQSVTLTSNSTGASSEIDIKSGNCVTKMGLSLGAETGTDSTSVSQGIALEASGGVGEKIPVLLTLNVGA